MTMTGSYRYTDRISVPIGIHAICSEIPALRVENEPRLEDLQLRRETYENRVGVQRIARIPPGQEASDLCVSAAHKLFASGQAALPKSNV